MQDELTQPGPASIAPDPPTNVPDTPDSGQPQPTQSTPAPPQQQDGPAQAQQQPVQATAPTPPTPQPAQSAPSAPAPVNSAPAPSAPPLTRGQQLAKSLRQTMDVLAPPSYRTMIDPNTGQVTRTEAPRSKTQIGVALALEALSGGLSGLAQSGPANIGKAGLAGIQVGQQIAAGRVAAQANQDEQAQTDYKNTTSELARRATTAESNSRIILNTSEAEARGAAAIDSLVAQNRASGILDNTALLDGETPITQAEMLAQMKAGKLNATDQLGPVAGRTLIENPDGSTRWEATHVILKDPSALVPLTQAMYDSFSAAHVPGYPSGQSIAPNQVVPVRFVVQANEIVSSHNLADMRLQDLRDQLADTPYAAKVPAKIDYAKPGTETAMQRYQTYVSHNAGTANDPLLTLQAMGADKRNPKTGDMEPNRDSGFVDQIAQNFGGWSLLQAAHDAKVAHQKDAETFSIIDTDAKAEAVMAAPGKFTPSQRSAATNFLHISQSLGAGKASQEARARAVATGADTEAMYKFGKNPVTGETLNLNNAPDAMLVSGSGNVVPQNMLSTYKPSQQEKQTADTARQVLAIAQGLRQAVATNPDLAGPLSGRSKQGLAKLGLGDAQAQKYLDDLSFLTSAATKMHTGRFSNEILKKMDSLIQPGMNVSQFGGALDSITGVATRYAAEDQLTTVAEFRQQNQGGQTGRVPTSQSSQPSQPPPAQRIVPAGATPGRDTQGRITGYKTADGKVVTF